ncbi:MAG TPA: tRNA (guanosine(46)-N7)-methyltransferase TrmB [Pirellulales bacterium]|nr:tRNA (guanosine(46)-N7)-methyltransferase TrmB [Pirellulales bacterium]
MSRRSLKKIDPALNLSEHLLTPEQLPRPWDAVRLFGRRAPLEVEVGSGKGLFLSAAATQWADHDFLGMEIAARYARFSAGRLAQRGLANARMIHGDARRVFAEFLPAECAAAVHVYFPDPWWKKRHQKRRVMSAPFLREIQRVLQPGGRLHFWTDVEEYFQATLELIAAATQWQGPISVAERAAQHDLDFHTHFERRMRLHGEAVHRAEFRRMQ